MNYISKGDEKSVIVSVASGKGGARKTTVRLMLVLGGLSL
jgi:hypothetical protein